MRVVVIGASSGLGRCIGVGLARRGRHGRARWRVGRPAWRMPPRRPAPERSPSRATSPTAESVGAAIGDAASALGGIDGLVYTPAIGPLAALADTDADTWRRVFDTNVIGAATVTAAALPHLAASRGVAVYLSSVSASLTPPWPGLGAYGVSKAALDKLVEAWRSEHPEIGFTRLVVG